MRRIFKSSKKIGLALLTALLVLAPIALSQLDQAYAAASYKLNMINSWASVGVNPVDPGGSVEEGAIVKITANVPQGREFDRWKVTSTPAAVTISYLYSSTADFKMPAGDVTVEAVLKSLSAGYVVKVNYGAIEVDGRLINSGDKVAPGTTVTLKADREPAGKVFDKWVSYNSEDVKLLRNEKDYRTTFRMPSYNVEFTATYKYPSENILTVNSGTITVDSKVVASGTKVDSGKTVTVAADTAPAGKVFDKWTSNSKTLVFANEGATTTTFTMPDSALTVTATYKDLAAQVKKQIITFIMGSTGYVVNNAGKAETKIMEAAPFVQDGRTMLPLRYAGEALGAQVAWNPATRQASCTLEGTTVIVTLGSKTMLVNGKAMEMDVAPAVVAGRTFLPLKWIAVALGFDPTSPIYKDGNAIKWDQATKAASIEKIIK